MNLFIDTNILLNFYSFSDDQLSIIDSLIEHIDNGGITLHLPKQVENEFERNRESKLRTAVIDFKNLQLPTAIPNVMRGTEAATQYEEALEKAKTAKKTLIANITGLAHERELNVDKKIVSLFSKATRHDEDDECYQRAILRTRKGNPPGKPDGLGDRYNWEILLKHLPEDDLYIVSKDSDYASPLGDIDKKVVRPMAFLANEWAQKKDGASLYIHTTIKGVVDHFQKLLEQPVAQNVQLEIIAAANEPPAQAPEAHAAEQENNAEQAPDNANQGEAVDLAAIEAANIAKKDAAVHDLCLSGSFSSTHEHVATLASMRGYITKDEAETLLHAALDNTQIRWIIDDKDVYDFFVGILTDHLLDIDGGLADAMIDLLGLNGPEEAESIDFGDSDLI